MSQNQSTIVSPLSEHVPPREYYKVVPTHKSETFIRIVRTSVLEPNKKQSPPRVSRLSQNPYVYHPKSYSRSKRSERVTVEKGLDCQGKAAVTKCQGSGGQSPIDETHQNSGKSTPSDQMADCIRKEGKTKDSSSRSKNERGFPEDSVPRKKKKLGHQQIPEKIIEPEPPKVVLCEPRQYFSAEFLSYSKGPADQAQLLLYSNPTMSSLPNSNLSFKNEDELNPDVMKSIEIVSNTNQKLSVPIHTALLQAFQGAKTDQANKNDFKDGVPNSFDIKLREEAMKVVTFLSDYRSGYAPIELQQNNGEQKDFQHRTGRGHFIRKKQCTLTLPRNCGVSYVKPTESTQSGLWEPLPPLVFQCSSECDPHFQSLNRQRVIPVLQEWQRCMQNDWLLFVQTDEDHMRKLLLGENHGQIKWVHGLHNIWPLMTEGVFLLVALVQKFTFDEEAMWADFHKAQIKIGSLIKKSTSGKQAFFSSIGIDDLSRYYIEESVNELTETHQQVDHFLKNQDSDTILQPLKLSKNLSTPQKVQTPVEHKLQENDLVPLTPQLLAQFRQYVTPKNMVTLSIKLQMYVDQNKWKGYSQETKNMLNLLMNHSKRRMEMLSIQTMDKRYKISKADREEKLVLLDAQLINIRVLKQTIVSLGEIDVESCSQQCPLASQGVQNFIRSMAKHRPSRNEIYKFTQRTSIQEYLVQYIPDSLKERRQAKQPRKQVVLEPQPLFKQTKEDTAPCTVLSKRTSSREFEDPIDKTLGLRLPLYCINTRDSFAFDLVEEVSIIQKNGRKYKRIEYFFAENNLPSNYGQFKKLFPKNEVGVVCYHDFFTEEQLKNFESSTFQTEKKAFKNTFLQMTVQPTIASNKVRRTKFFFGYRYMWTRTQLAEPYSYVGAGVRKDVTPPPTWIKDVESPLVDHGIVEPNFINSVAINVYHDGKEGLAQHFDDAVRFKQPIFTVRLFSDARLSFGSQFYGFCNGAFVIPLPRGCICVMTENSYAANGVKHCVRPCDMTGKSSALILRQMHSLVTTQVEKYDRFVDFPLWFSTLSSDPAAVSYADQKKREAEYLDSVKPAQTQKADDPKNPSQRKPRARKPRCSKTDVLQPLAVFTNPEAPLQFM